MCLCEAGAIVPYLTLKATQCRQGKRKRQFADWLPTFTGRQTIYESRNEQSVDQAKIGRDLPGLSCNGNTARSRFAMGSAERFSKPITLKDGREIDTLAGAFDIIAGLPEASRNHADWQFAFDLLRKMSGHARPDVVNLARTQLAWALKSEGMV